MSTNEHRTEHAGAPARATGQRAAEPEPGQRDSSDVLAEARRLREALDHVAAFIYMKDSQSRYVYANRPTLELFGCTAEELVGCDDSHFFPPGAAQRLQEIDARVLRGERTTEEIDVPDAAGGRRVYREVKTPIYAQADRGTIWGLLGISTDITGVKQSEEVLRQNEQSLLEAQRLAHMGSWQWETSTDTVTWSDELYRITGRDPGLPPPAYAEMQKDYTPDSWTRLNAAVQKAIESGDPYELELEFVRPDGTTVFQAARGAATYDSNGRIIGLHGTVQDITERRRAEAEIARTLSLLASTLESTADGILVVDGAGGIVRFNERFKEIWSLPEAIVASRDDNAAIGFVLDQLEDPETFLKSVRDLYRSPESVSFDVLTFKDGRVVERYSQPQRNGDQIVGRVWSFRDVTTRKQAEDAQGESEKRFRGLFESSRDAIMTLDPPSWNFTAGNPAAVKMFGTKDEADFVSRAPWELSPERQPDGRASMEKAAEMIETALRDGSRSFAWTHRRTNGEDFDADVLLTRIDLGHKVILQGTVHDLTDRKRAEEEKARLEAQLQQAQKMESVGRLAGGVAHDFNNMLSVILGRAEIALDSVDPASPLHADLHEIRTAAKRSADLTRQLLAFARKQTVAPRVLDLNEAVAGSLKMLGRLIGEDIHLEWLPGPDLWRVKIDPAQIDQILANLCVNSRDAITGVGTISIGTDNSCVDDRDESDQSASVSGEFVKLMVGDNGCGMEKETLGQIFEPFFTTKGVGKGTGLGLASVYGAVKQNGGFIKVRSTPGSGTKFTIFLPRYLGQDELPRPEAENGPANCGHETILLVEDEPAILSLTRKVLERRGYVVLTARGGSEALQLARDHAGPIHLLVTDVVMPEMNGRTLSRHLLAVRPSIKRLFMSGYTAESATHQGVIDEGVSFLQKPFSVSDLAAKVRETLDGP